MRIAYLDTFAGISGDMTLGAFLSAGVPVEELERQLRLLDLDGWSLRVRPIERSMISALKVDVDVHHHHHGHDHDHGHAHDHAHKHDHAHRHHHRGYAEIVALIEKSALSDRVKTDAHAVFHAIGRAEAKIHATELEKIHFHEVGAVDSIIDIVGVAVCMELAGIDRLYSTRIKTGSGGFIDTQHGIMPVPAPATLDILAGYPIELTNIPYELTTPTGAAIVAALSSGVLEGTERMTIVQTGYGAGSRDIPGLPNLLRLIIADMPEQFQNETMIVLETNIDDMNPEIYPWLLERLLEEGAHDAFLTPVLMKKGRPGQLLTVTCDASRSEHLTAVICRESTTTGVRMRDVARRKLAREVITYDSRFGPITVKVIHAPQGVRRVPEFEECRRIARERALPLHEVYALLGKDLG